MGAGTYGAGTGVTVAAVESNVTAGCPVNGDGTINLIHVTAWLVSRSDGRVFSRSGTVATSGTQGENTIFRPRPFSGPVPQHLNFKSWYQGPSVSDWKRDRYSTGAKWCSAEGKGGGCDLTHASDSGPPLILRERLGNVFFSGMTS